ncbi:MAG: NADH-quinone oxidoreductase subunit J [Helicobacteraceae bacterium]|jgi:NADH-quinone oxidoreductase subunit J|nr:NADH-quinone oxidoreductase subunit J [Helicobacteraceae bacterium]
MFEAVGFYFFGFVTAAAFLAAILARQPIYAFTALATGMIFVGGLFFTLGADFMGVVQIVVYTGAVMALYVFGMMFFDTSKMVEEEIKNQKLVVFLSVAIALFAVLAICGANMAFNSPPASEDNTKAIGFTIFKEYILPFEISGLLLLTAMIAGIVLASKKMEYSVAEERKK